MIIPKELQALERLKSTLLAEGYWQDALEDINIIENALNEYYRLLKEDDQTTKKLKALEVIKPLVDLTKGTNYCWLWLGLNGVQISQENYDLLKEALDL